MCYSKMVVKDLRQGVNTKVIVGSGTTREKFVE